MRLPKNNVVLRASLYGVGGVAYVERELDTYFYSYLVEHGERVHMLKVASGTCQHRTGTPVAGETKPLSGRVRHAQI